MGRGTRRVTGRLTRRARRRVSRRRRSVHVLGRRLAGLGARRGRATRRGFWRDATRPRARASNVRTRTDRGSAGGCARGDPERSGDGGARRRRRRRVGGGGDNRRVAGGAERPDVGREESRGGDVLRASNPGRPPPPPPRIIREGREGTGLRAGERGGRHASVHGNTRGERGSGRVHRRRATWTG